MRYIFNFDESWKIFDLPISYFVKAYVAETRCLRLWIEAVGNKSVPTGALAYLDKRHSKFGGPKSVVWGGGGGRWL